MKMSPWICAGALLLSASAASASEYVCEAGRKSDPTYRIKIQIHGDEVEVLQSSSTARYAPMKLKLKAAKPTNIGEAPELSCQQTSTDDKKPSTEIRVFKDAVQVMQSSPTARYAPVQYSIVK